MVTHRCQTFIGPDNSPCPNPGTKEVRVIFRSGTLTLEQPSVWVCESHTDVIQKSTAMDEAHIEIDVTNEECQGC